ncbi:glucan biosynthesis protein C [Rhizobium rosettiformans]|uniref:Glucan biosynthesis protein C n=2 Tax=Rhizobium rosettiformans TaxID=1368430 RepID=A0A4S8Q4N3_9HYPH|nr:acyltransferase family protein [Rhizobium rosettiformans]MBB5275825.1 glucan biosynthesis protein C [Rhizobium rosettiformans]THV37562.1 glucan biosynthesis protein C [Rhizobium rosettiformans W3]
MSAGSAREHQWDSLRAFLMLLGIPYHAAMAYNARVLWDIQSPDKSEILTFLSGFLVTFRMPAFFMVAGYFAVMMLEKRPPVLWLRGRLTRLGVPFLTGLVLLAPLQIALIDLNGAMTGTTPLPTALDRAVSDVLHPGFSWIMHLWFLPALMAYSILLALAWRPLHRPPLASLVARIHRHAVAHPLMSLSALAFAIAGWEVSVHLSHQAILSLPGTLPYLLAHGIDPYLRYLPFFLVGATLRSAPAIRKAFVWQKGWQLPTIAITTAVLASLLRGRGASEIEALYNAVDGAAAILLSLVVIGIAERFWNRPDARVDRIVDASFTIYLLHHPIIYGLATIGLLVHWPPLLEFLLICLVTLVLSYAAHRLIRLSPLALFLFNGLPMSRKSLDDSRPQSGITTLR